MWASQEAAAARSKGNWVHGGQAGGACAYVLSFWTSELERFSSLVLYDAETPTGFLHMVDRTMLPELLLNALLSSRWLEKKQ